MAKANNAKSSASSANNDRRAEAQAVIENLRAKNGKTFNEQLAEREELNRAVGKAGIDPSVRIDVSALKEPDALRVEMLQVPNIAPKKTKRGKTKKAEESYAVDSEAIAGSLPVPPSAPRKSSLVAQIARGDFERDDNRDLLVPTVDVEVEDESDEEESDEDVSEMDTVLVMPKMKDDGHYEYAADRKIPIAPGMTSLDTRMDNVIKADPAEDFSASQATKDSVRLRKDDLGWKDLPPPPPITMPKPTHYATPTPATPTPSKPRHIKATLGAVNAMKKKQADARLANRANKTVSPEDDGTPIEMPEDSDEFVVGEIPIESSGGAPKVEREAKKTSILETIANSSFWRYAVKGEVLEAIVKENGDVNSIKRAVVASVLLDVGLAVSGRSKIWLDLVRGAYQQRLVSADRSEILRAMYQVDPEIDAGGHVSADTSALEARIDASKYLTEAKKKVLKLRLAELVRERESASINKANEIKERALQILNDAITARVDKEMIAKEAVNTASFYTGALLARPVLYNGIALGRAYSNYRKEKRLGLRDDSVKEAVKKGFSEWWTNITLRAEKDKVMKFAQALAPVLTTAGMLAQLGELESLTEYEAARKIADSLGVDGPGGTSDEEFDIEAINSALRGDGSAVAAAPVDVNKVATDINKGEDAWEGKGVFESEAPAVDPFTTSAEDTVFTPGESEAGTVVTSSPETTPVVSPEVETEAVPEIGVVRAGDGVTWILMRQFKERADEFGYNPANDGDIHEWAREKANALAKAKGYLDEHGFETRIKKEAIGSLGLVLNEEGDGFTIEYKSGRPMEAGQRALFFEDVADTPALLKSQGVEYVSGALEPDDAVRPIGSTSAPTPELSTTPAVPETPAPALADVEDDVDLPEPEPEPEPTAQTPEASPAGRVAEIRVDSYGKMKVFETPDGRYTLDLSKFEVRRRHVEMMQELAISPDSIDTPEERSFFQKLFAYAYTLDEMRKQGEEGGRVYTGLAKEVNRLFVMSYSRMGVEVNPGNPLILPLLKPEYRIR